MGNIYIPDETLQRYVRKHRGRVGDAKGEIKRIVEENAPEFTEDDWSEVGYMPESETEGADD